MEKINQNKLSFQKALSLLKRGEVVALPTETVYGLGAIVSNKEAIGKVFALKKRPFSNPLILHCYDKEQLKWYSKNQHPLLDALIDDFCPGPLTLILDKTSRVPKLVTSQSEKVAIRMPSHPVMRRILKKLKETKEALVAPSANLSGKLSPTRAEHVWRFFHGRVPVLDGGSCTLGLESTVLEPNFSTLSLRIWRLGVFGVKDFRIWLKNKGLDSTWKINKKNLSLQKKSKFVKVLSPGQMTTHYKPSVPLVIFELPVKNKNLEAECKAQLSKLYPKRTYSLLNLPDSGLQCAKKIYNELFILSKNKKNVIYVFKVLSSVKTREEIWEAIWDRLTRGASHVRKVSRISSKL